MKKAYSVTLIVLFILGIVYANTGSEKKAEEPEKKTEEVEKKAEEVDEKTEEAENEAEETEKKAKEVEKKPEEAEKKTEKTWKYNPIDICKFPLTMEVGHFVQLKECNKRKLKLEQVDCGDIGRDGGDFPCYRGCEEFEVRANFPAIFDASLSNTSPIIAETKVYWKDDVNQIIGSTGHWEKLTVCIDTWKTKIWKTSSPGETPVGDIVLHVRPPDEPKKETKDDKKSEE